MFDIDTYHFCSSFSPETIIVQLNKFGQVIQLNVHISEGAAQALLDVTGHVDVIPKRYSLIFWQGLTALHILIARTCEGTLRTVCNDEKKKTTR